MAKSTRSNGSDTPVTGAARPRAGRRRTEPQSKQANGERAASPDHSAATPDQFRRQEMASPDTQELSPEPQIERDEPTPSELSEDEIRLRAYHRYLDRGALDGADFDDWLQAEIELKKR